MPQRKRESLRTGDEEMLYRVLDALPEAVLVADDEMRYVYANAPARELTGRTMSQLRKLTVARISAPGQPVEPAWKAFMEAGTCHGDYELTRPEGTTVTVEFNSRTNILPGRHIGFLRDVTAARRLERRLRLDEEKFVQAFVQAPVAMALRVLGTGVLVEANNEFQALSGRWRSEVIGQLPDDMGLWEDGQPVADLICSAAPRGAFG